MPDDTSEMNTRQVAFETTAAEKALPWIDIRAACATLSSTPAELIRSMTISFAATDEPCDAAIRALTARLGVSASFSHSGTRTVVRLSRIETTDVV